MYRIFKFFILSVITGTFLFSCSERTDVLPAGKWRGIIELNEANVPFEFTVSETKDGKKQLKIINGEEHIAVRDVEIEGDSVFVEVGLYDSELNGVAQNDRFEGHIIKAGKEGPAFEAQLNGGSRFELNGSGEPVDLKGSWSVELKSGDETRPGVLLFKQEGHHLAGSLLTPTGDYRYFEGVADGQKFRLSTFGGAYPYLIEGSTTMDKTLDGRFISGGGVTDIKGYRDDDAKLPDAYGQTYLKDSVDKFNFTFPNLQGDSVSLSDAKYAGKVVIVSIMGSWCPNCMDEMAFLAPWYQATRKRGVEIIALAFERKNTLEYARKVIDPLIDRYDVKYDILLAGEIGGRSAEKALPQLNAVLSFPTTIFIDRKGDVRYIHSGFSGPATGKYYDQLKTDFESKTDELLSE